ncbi:MAG: OsmC family protein [Weeksellaceae bacterium]|nr:OsmC family protein [Weeksellaceae bacterium]
MVTFHLPAKGLKGVAKTREFEFEVDEPEFKGGSNVAPMPIEYLLGALASSIGINMRSYADEQGWDVGEIDVEVRFHKGENDERIALEKVTFGNEISDEQHAALIEASKNCPVSKMLFSEVHVEEME